MVTLTDVPVTELRAGDWPVSLVGFRPIQRLEMRPRKREVELWVDGSKLSFPFHHVVRRVRRRQEVSNVD